MSKILKKVMVGTAMVLTLSGVVGMVPSVTASAATYRHDDRVIMHNRYKQDGYCIAELEVEKNTFETMRDICLECGESYYTTYYSFKSNGYGNYGVQWGFVSAEYNNNTRKYLVTFRIRQECLYGPVRIYCDLGNGDSIYDNNNGYDYKF